MVELSQILENSVGLNFDENLPERQTSNSPNLSSAIRLLRVIRIYLVVKPVPPGNASRFLEVDIPVSSNSPADSLQTWYG